ncbi:hypothetical protein ACMYSQ_012338 [Aspergillus niger]
MENSLHSPDTFEGAALDKYTLINRYISIALVKRRGLTSSAGALSAKAADKKPWCAFWKKSGDGVEAGFVRPDERFETDMRSDLRAFDIEPRRKRTGFNGLTAAKTNFFVQSTGYSRAGSSMVFMELAVCLPAGPRDWICFSVIVGILFLNTIVGW